MKIHLKNIFKKKSNPPAGRHGFKITIPVILLFVIVFGLIIPEQVHAWDPAKDLVIAVGTAIQWIMGWLIKASASFFEGMLGIGFKDTIETIRVGWTACRDFANMFFILFMVVIAFGTILRIEQYGIKKLLPKVIGIALLINFSMVFCSVIVDFSNLTADFFIKDIKNNIYGTPAENGTPAKMGAISATFADSFNVTGVYTTFTDCKDIQKLGAAECDRYSSFWEPMTLALCKDAWQRKSAECTKNGSVTLKTDENVSFLNLILGYTVGSIIMLMASFTLFAGGIMLLFRIVAIWFLVTISPLVFMCYILPGLKSNWQKWWKTFINWCIFAPAYSFFVWMAIQIAVSGANKRMGLTANQYTISGNYDALSNSFVTNPGQQLISYLVILGFLIGGLIVAKQLGVYGADATMKLAQGARKGVTNWAKRREQFNRGGLLRGLGSIPGLQKTWIGRRLKYAGMGLQTKSLSEKQKKRYSSYSPDDLSAEINGEIFPKLPSQTRLLLAQLASSEKYKDKINTKAAQRVRDTLKLSSFGAKDKATEDFENARIDSIRNEEEIKRRINDIKASETLIEHLNKIISLKALENRTVEGLVKIKLGGQAQYDIFVRNKKGEEKNRKILKELIHAETSASEKTENKPQAPPQTPPKTP
jgi:hypothetical protein